MISASQFSESKRKLRNNTLLMSKTWLHGNLQKDKTTTIIMIKIPQTKIRTIMMKKKTKTKKIRLKMIMKMTIKIIKTMITQKKKKYQKNLQLKRKLI